MTHLKLHQLRASKPVGQEGLDRYPLSISYVSNDMDGRSNLLFEGLAAGTSGANVPALVALIVSAAKNIEAEYAKSSIPSVPSLDDLTPHPMDSAVPSAALRQATQTLEGACTQLCATVARPQHTVVNVSSPLKAAPI